MSNEFTPLLPAAADNPPEEQPQHPQPSTANRTNTGIPGALALLPEPPGEARQTSSGSLSEHHVESHTDFHSESRTQTRSERRSSTRVSYGAIGDIRRESRDEGTSSAIADGYEGEQLARHRSRLGSYPVQDEPENIRKRDSIHIVAVERTGDDSPSGDGEESGGDADSKFMVVGAVRFWFVFLTVLLGYFVACFDITLMASSHPVITSYFNASNEASWLTTAFMITNTGFQPLWGRLSDTIGRKSVYLLVLTIFALTNLWCGLATDIGSFIAARTVCGVGAGGTMSMGLVVVNDLVKVEHRGTYISHINVAFGIGAACGAAFGGVICDSIGWRWAFGIQVPVIALCMICVFFTVPNKLGPMLMTKSTNKDGDNPGWAAVKNFDNLGLCLLVSAVTFFILFFNMGGNEFPWNHPAIIAFIVVAVVLGAAALFVEKRAKQPVMPLHLLVTHPYANLTYANFLAGIASNTVLFNAPLWFQAVELNTASASGLRLASPAIAGSIAGVLTGYIITYTRRLKPMLIIGSVVYLGGSIAVFFLSRQLPSAVKVVLITPTPMSQGFIYPGSMMAAFATSPQEEQGVVTTTLSLWRNLGIVVGVSVSSLVFQNMLSGYLEQGVVGPEREWYVARAKSSVRAVVDMPEPYQGQVRDAYAMALRMSFVTAIVASALLLILMIPMKLPKLRRGKAMNVAGGD